MENKTAKAVANFATAVIDHRAAERFAASVGIKTQHPAKATPVRTRRTGLISSIVFFALFLLFGYAANATYSSAAYTGNGMTGATLSLSGLAVLNLTIAVLITVVSTIRALIRKANAPEQAVAQATTSPESESESAAEVVDDLPLSKEDKAAMIAERQKLQWEGIVRGVLYRLLEEKGPYVSDINTAKDFVTTSYNNGVRKDHEAAEAKLVTYYKMKGQRYTKKPAPARLTFDEAFPPGGFRDQVVRSVLDPVVGIDYQVSAQKALVRLTLPIVATVKDAQALVEPLRTSFDTIRDVVLINPTKDDPRSVTLELWFTERPKPYYETNSFGSEFFIEHPIEDARRYPAGYALNAANDLIELPIHHTLIVGATGSGKGSVIQTLIAQYAPLVKQGVAELWGADPKNSELKLFRNSSLFTRLAFDDEDIRTLIHDLEQVRKERSEQSGRSFKASRDTPVIIFIFDEGSSWLVMPDNKKDALPDLYNIAAKGRSDGVYIAMAAQQAQKEIFGQLRTNFAVRIALRTETPTDTDIVLGAGATDRGATAHLIPLANEANGYESAGIGYVDQDGAGFVKMRFPFVSDEDIDALIAQFPKVESPAAGADRLHLTKPQAMPPRPVLLPTPVDDPFPEGS